MGKDHTTRTKDKIPSSILNSLKERVFINLLINGVKAYNTKNMLINRHACVVIGNKVFTTPDVVTIFVVATRKSPHDYYQ